LLESISNFPSIIACLTSLRRRLSISCVVSVRAAFAWPTEDVDPATALAVCSWVLAGAALRPLICIVLGGLELLIFTGHLIAFATEFDASIDHFEKIFNGHVALPSLHCVRCIAFTT
jgi:hypothetical protein